MDPAENFKSMEKEVFMEVQNNLEFPTIPKEVVKNIL